MHPMVCGCWFGMLATALNLLPFGQLDGGHIVYAVFGERIAKMVSAATALGLAAMIGLSITWIVPTVMLLAMWRWLGLRPPGAAESLRAAEQRAPRVCPDRAGRAHRLLHANADPDRGSGADLTGIQLTSSVQIHKSTLAPP